MSLSPLNPSTRGLADRQVAPANAPAAPVSAAPLVTIDSRLFRDVTVTLDVILGTSTMSIEQLLALKAGAVVTLDTRLDAPVELRLNQTLVARGEIVAVDDNFGLRIIEIAGIA